MTTLQPFRKMYGTCLERRLNRWHILCMESWRMCSLTALLYLEYVARKVFVRGTLLKPKNDFQVRDQHFPGRLMPPRWRLGAV